MKPSVPQGLLYPGNINLYNRPDVPNPDFNGNLMNLYSENFTDVSGNHVLYPRIVKGKFLSSRAAQDHYYNTEQHLGIFTDDASAEAYAQQLDEEFDSGKYNQP